MIPPISAQRALGILQVLPWDQAAGGLASIAGTLAEHLSDHGHDVSVLHPGSEDGLVRKTTEWGFAGYETRLRSTTASPRLRAVGGFVAFAAPTLLRLRRLLREQSIDIVNVHYPVAKFGYFALLRRLMGIRLVVSIHGSDIFPGGRPRESYPWELRQLFAAVDRIVAPSRSLRDGFIELFPRLADRTIYIHNGIAPETLDGVQEDVAPPGEPMELLCVAAHNESKAVDVLLRAYAALRSSRPDLRLTLIGDGPLRNSLEELATSLAVGDGVSFLGRQSHAEVTRRMRECDIFVLPSRAEAFGLVVAEAMAAGRPVVASAVGGIREIVDHEHDGVLVPPDDPDALSAALERVLDEPEFRRKISTAAPGKIRDHFLAPRMGEDYERLFMELVRRHGRPGHESQGPE